MKRIGLFGGSFDPIHFGHLRIALDAKQSLGLAEVWFLPTVLTPLKSGQAASFDHRCKMIELMIKPYRKLRLSTLESSLPQPNYTITTVRELVSFYPNVEFVWIMGSDQADQFSLWKEPEELLRLIRFGVYPRNPEDSIPNGMIRLPYRNYLAYSSTEIRQGKVELTKPSIVAYMMGNGLYLEEIAKSMVSPKRWIHVASMCDLALRIAKAHQIDENKVRTAALLHDCMKNQPRQRLATILTIHEPKYLTKPQALWHQRAGMYFAQQTLKIRDRSILAAIGHHVEGDHHDPIVRVIYLADKLDESRGYDGRDTIDLALRDLDAAYKIVRNQQAEYLLKEGIDV